MIKSQKTKRMMAVLITLVIISGIMPLVTTLLGSLTTKGTKAINGM